MSEQISLSAEVPQELGGKRLDQILAELFPEYSDMVQINGEIKNIPKEKLFGEEQVVISATIEVQREYEAQNIELDIVYEDDDILVINKPEGLVVHPGAGNPDGTVLNALLHHFPDIANVPRAGIVHRLDKDTTGLMVVAKTIPAQTKLVANLQARRNFTREYEAICTGTMSYLTHPLVGDQSYNGRPRPPKKATPELFDCLQKFRRQALHAVMLTIEHPITGEVMTWHAPIPADMQYLTEMLREDTQLHGSDEF